MHCRAGAASITEVACALLLRPSTQAPSPVYAWQQQTSTAEVILYGRPLDLHMLHGLRLQCGCQIDMHSTLSAVAAGESLRLPRTRSTTLNVLLVTMLCGS